MTENAEPLDFELRIYNMISDSQDRLFERFDDLHKRNIDDTQVIQALRKGGYTNLAEDYIEWSGAIDPDAEDDNTTTSPAVPDPGDAPSYQGLDAYNAMMAPRVQAYVERATLDKTLGTERGDRESWPATPGELTKELTDAGINASNLEQGLIDAYNANRMNHGIFFAERSNDGVHWHVYKKRSHEDNGAYIATANDREGAASILASLGTGTIEGQ